MTGTHNRNVGPDSESFYAGVSIDTPRKLKDAPSYLWAVFWNLDTPEIWLQPTDVSLSTPSYLGCIFTLAARSASVDLCVEYVNELDTLIHERTYARYAIYVRLTSGVTLPLLYEVQVMQSMDVGTSVFFYVVYVSRTWMGLCVGYVHVTDI